MATLLISAAINLAIGLAINALFPPPDVNQEGPRLADLGYTSAGYGKFINIPFGTDRMDGNIIETQDPAIEEVVNQESTSGKGGGPEVNTTTYTYFFTGRISFCIEGASDLIRLWGDGKMIFDATGSTQLIKEGTSLIFYPGGVSQLQDPEEVSRRGINIPAYRHLTTVKLTRMPLADFGNRIPNLTAEIAFVSNITAPFLTMTEPAGLDVPGSPTGADVTHMAFNPQRNELYSLKGNTGNWVADASALTHKFTFGSGGSFADPIVGLDGFMYGQNGGNNSEPLIKVDIETGEVIASLGSSGLGLVDTLIPARFTNTGSWHHLQTIIPGVGVKNTAIHLNTSFPAGGPPNGAVVDADNMEVYHILSTTDGLVNDFGPLSGVCISDHDRGRFFILQNDSLNGEYRLVKYEVNFSIGLLGASQTSVTPSVVHQFTRGSVAGGDDFEGSGDIQGWAVNRVNGDLMFGNGSSIVLYNPDTDTILAQRVGNSGGFQGHNNYYSGSLFAWILGSGTPSASRLYIIDTRTLQTIREVANVGSVIGWPGGDSVIHEPSQVWDDRVGAIFLSRVDVASTAPANARIIKVFVNRVEGLGVGLDSVVSALSTSYQRQVMAGLEASDIDVTTLIGETVQGYTINRKSTMKAALEPLRSRFQFDAIQSDWIMKFPVRGQAPVVTIPQESVGILKRGRDQNEEPAVQEIRQDDLSLPMRLAVRYKNKDVDYNVDMEHDKRHLFPNPTMRSKSEVTVDIPIVDTASNMKQTAQEHLLTIWNERVSYKTIIPWTYIKLDPSDVFNMGVFNETAQLRMLENDLGQGWAIEITGVVEETGQYTSTIGGGLNLGHITPNVPSGLPTRLFPLDAPLLSTIDLLLTPISNAYMAVGAFESSWPGGTISKSLDDVTYQNTGSANVEAVSAKVNAAPGAWALVNGDFPNRIQEVADGGSMTITAIRRANFWASSTELNVLAGFNHLAVVGDDGEVEVIGFIDVVDNGDNTYTLQRLLRGRLGTEDIASGGMNVGDIVTGLVDSVGVKEAEPIVRQRLALPELDTELFFKGVTTGTAAANADPISFTYTGRDLKPYFPADIRAVSDGSGGLDVSWQRRTRGPQQGEWLDGTGTVPLNETIEQYEVTLANLAGDFITKVVDNLTTVNFSAAEVALGGVSGGVAKQPWPLKSGDTVNGTFDGGTINVTDTPLTEGGWVNIDSPTGWFWRTSGSGLIPPTDSRISPTSTEFLHYLNNTSDPQRTIRNTIDLVADLGMSSGNIPISTARANIWVATPTTGDSIDLWLHVLDSANNILATVSQLGFRADSAQSGVSLGTWISVGSIYDAALDPWPQRDLEITLDQPGAAKLAFDIGINKTGTTFDSGEMGYDHLEVEIVAPPPDITVKVVQVSETGKKSPIAARQVT